MLDLPTLLLVEISFTLLITLLLGSAALPRDASNEQRLWAIGNFVACLGLAVGSAETLPIWVHGALSYGLMGCGLAIILRGLLQFCGSKMSTGAVVVISLAAIALPGYFAMIAPSLQHRLLVTGLYFGALNMACAWTLWSQLKDEAREVMWASLLGFVFLGVALIVRGLYMVALEPGQEDDAKTSLVISLSMLTIPIAQVSIGFGLIVMVAHRYAHKLNQLSMLDSLTGAHNRTALEGIALRTLNRARQSHRNITVAMIDADHFKAINDAYGHSAGDAVLQHLVALLIAQVRPGDVVVRYGGEEFLVVLDGLNLLGAKPVAERLRELIEQSEVTVANFKLNYKISIGLSCTDNCGFDLKKLIDAADSALYRAKQEGRNRVCIDVSE